MPASSLLLTLAQAAPAPQQSMWPSLLMMGLMIAAMWFLLIAPQRKKQKEHQKMLSSIGVGDEVVTQGGIMGTIQQIKDDRLVIRSGENTRLELAKDFVIKVEKKEKSS